MTFMQTHNSNLRRGMYAYMTLTGLSRAALAAEMRLPFPDLSRFLSGSLDFGGNRLDSMLLRLYELYDAKARGGWLLMLYPDCQNYVSTYAEYYARGSALGDA